MYSLSTRILYPLFTKSSHWMKQDTHWTETDKNYTQQIAAGWKRCVKLVNISTGELQSTLTVGAAFSSWWTGNKALLKIPNNHNSLRYRIPDAVYKTIACNQCLSNVANAVVHLLVWRVQIPIILYSECVQWCILIFTLHCKLVKNFNWHNNISSVLVPEEWRQVITYSRCSCTLAAMWAQFSVSKDCLHDIEELRDMMNRLVMVSKECCMLINAQKPCSCSEI